MINRKYILQKKPVYEYSDPRSSENSKHAENQRKQQRRLVSILKYQDGLITQKLTISLLIKLMMMEKL